MATSFLFGPTVYRTALGPLRSVCRACRITTVRPKQVSIAQFSSTPAPLARKGRAPTRPLGGQNSSPATTKQPDQHADNLAEQILDEFFGSGKADLRKKAAVDGARSSIIGGKDFEENSQEAPLDEGAAGRATPRFNEESDRRRPREEPMPVTEPEWGTDALSKNPNAVESVEERAARRAVLQRFQDLQSPDEAASGKAAEGDDWYVDQSYNLDDSYPNQEDLVPRWMKGIALAEQRSRGQAEQEDSETIADDRTGPLKLREIVEELKAENGSNLVVISMRDKCDYTDFLVIVEGRSKKQIYALADAVRRRAKHRLQHDASLPSTLTIEGVDSDDWMLVDLGRFIVHCFTPEARARYNLEGLWTVISDPLLALARESDVEVGRDDLMDKQLEEAERSWDTRPAEDYRLKQIERKHIISEDEVLEKFNSAR
ncbi:Mitochondrial assembly of ribosomal large subunit protein 1 [Geranomyces variabilis]|uniref:Mitochondrial assembly of ribosomal large subunit protein 1 n=1 Tax=Geranomyces variabilis TaxID=109894 RepID=A0AAD5XKS2_9FUNG|nr:Mitochondrial assembly of ribosomal large subunit protein 1 [Geranomyces variabilis]